MLGRYMLALGLLSFVWIFTYGNTLMKEFELEKEASPCTGAPDVVCL